MINGMKTGFVLDGKGNKLLPITHINLIIGDDGRSIRNTLDAVDNKLTSVQTYEDLLSINTNNLFSGSIAYVVNDKTYYSYTPDGWELMTTGSNNASDADDIYSHIWIGPDPPEDQNMIWIDTNSDGIIEGETDLNLLFALQELVSEMQVELDSLRNRVKYLEENGVVAPPVIPDDPDDPNDPIYDEDDIILLEDGTSLFLEDGSDLLLEEQVVDEPVSDEDDIILFEDGSEILLEDGSSLLLEIQVQTEVPTSKEKAILFESGTEILLENGNNLLLEIQ